MRLLILGGADNRYVRELQRAAEPTHEVAVGSFPRLAAREGTPRGARFESEHGPLDGWDAVLVRGMPRGSLEQIIFRMDILGRLERNGTVVVNGPRALETAIDKYLTLARLTEAGLRVPPTCVCQGWREALGAFEELGGDVVLKPLFGGEGRGISRLTDLALAERAFKLLEQLGAVLYLQPFLPHAGYDLRLLVIGDQVFAIRRRNDADWRTNVTRGAVAEAWEADEASCQLARRAAAAVGADVAGVDLLPVPGQGLFVLEVNAVPGWSGLAAALQLDIAATLIDYVVQRVTGRHGPA